ncbi:MAG: phenylalanine--tRNA ligase subunit beta [Candidatus Methylomirabilia bacterium]
MRVPLKWLSEFVRIEVPLEDLLERLPAAGIEVGEVERVGVDWDPERILVGEITAVRQHPNADRLTLATVVYGGGRTIEVVTGAPNIAVGMAGVKVPLALSGARLVDAYAPEGGFTVLKPSKIRGVRSEGMVCSEKELGISAEHGGILLLPGDAAPGTPLVDYLGDTVLHVELTPNLSHCLSLAGIAREVAAMGCGTLVERAESFVEGDGAAAAMVAVRIEAPELCGRYCAAVVSGVTIGPAPFGMRHRLRLAGIRPINNVVDATNYVMWETGQPLHAFDLDTLRGEAGSATPGIVVRPSREGESMSTLDGVERPLAAGTLLICDGAGPVALAGVMGGLQSEVTEKTRRVLIEAAQFDRTSIRVTAIGQRLPSEASLRFGRGVPAAGSLDAARRAAESMRLHAGGTIARGVVDVYPRPLPAVPVLLPAGEIERVLGFEVPAAEVRRILESLGCAVYEQSGAFTVLPPPTRLDLAIPADLVEEVARITGYHRIPSAPMSGEFAPPRPNPDMDAEDRARDTLVACGLTEVITYSLTDPAWCLRLGLEADVSGFVCLANPMTADRTHLRRHILPGMLETLRYNLRFVDRVAIFELARVYLPSERQLPEEPRRLALLLSGASALPWWGNPAPPPYDFFHAKGLLEALAERLNVGPLSFAPYEGSPYQGGRAAVVSRGGAAVGTFGELDPALRHLFDLPERRVVLGEFDAAVLLAGAGLGAYRTLSRYPALTQDLAIVCPEELPASQVEAAVRAAAGDLLAALRLFDVYRGDPLPAGTRSLAFTLTFQAPDRTLAEEDVLPARARIIAALKEKLGVELRA